MILAALLVLSVILVLILTLIWFTTPLTTIRSFGTISKFLALPQHPAMPVFGLPYQLTFKNLGDLQDWTERLVENESPVKGMIFTFFMGFPSFATNIAEDHEIIMSSSKHIEKGPAYTLLEGWLNDGLLLSKGDKWKQRRKLLTPSFHFKILDNNMDCLNRSWRNVAKKLLAHDGAPLDPNKYLCRGSLDAISETAMGIKLEETAGSDAYVEAVRSTNGMIGFRVCFPIFMNSLLFHLSPKGWRYRKNLKILKNFTRKIIKQKSEAYRKDRSTSSNGGQSQVSAPRSKRPQPFLETLLELDVEQNGILSEQDIQEEVDTFMFEGHDTTACAFHFIFFELGLNPDIQERAYQEQLDIFGNDDRDATMEDLTRMNYLEQVIKEVLRLYPPVPYMSRVLSEDCTLSNGLVLPRDTMVNIFPHLVHRNPKYYPNPTVFDPERFHPELIRGRHPFAFIPFSAGSRNCIGQKFAMMEMKTALSLILRLVKMKTLTRREDVKVEMLVILQPSVPIMMEFTPRRPQ